MVEMFRSVVIGGSGQTVHLVHLAIEQYQMIENRKQKSPTSIRYSEDTNLGWSEYM